MTEDSTPPIPYIAGDGERLWQLHQEWSAAVDRAQAAQQTFQGATNQEQILRYKFLGAVEFAAGGPAEWVNNSEKKRIEFRPVPTVLQKGSGETTDEPSAPAPPFTVLERVPVNGATPEPEQIPGPTATLPGQ